MSPLFWYSVTNAINNKQNTEKTCKIKETMIHRADYGFLNFKCLEALKQISIHQWNSF